MSYRAMGTMYATAGLGQTLAERGRSVRLAPKGYAPPWRPRGFHSFQGFGGSASDMITLTVRAVQRALIAKGFNVGRTGADGTWGTQSLSAFSSALGVPAGYELGAPTGARGSQNIAMPEEHWRRLNMMPNRAAGTGTGVTGERSREPAATTTTPSTTTPRTPVPEPSPTDILDEGDQGFAMPEWAPYALGGVALLGIGGFFLWQGRGKKRSAPAKPAPVAANRRRRRRRRSSRGRR